MLYHIHCVAKRTQGGVQKCLGRCTQGFTGRVQVAVRWLVVVYCA